ncbi:MAG: amidase [Ignavibacteria bacterium RBG_16_34_14]|nr:MAG: amidase [Ignavibacteria bacterium RBG_16_34_14]
MKTQLLFLYVFFSILISSNILPQSITKEIIENAEKIIGIDFTDAERDSMLTLLDEQLGNYQKIREVELANSVSPAILFNPIPVGFEFPKEQDPVQFSNYTYVKMSADKNALAFYSIGELAELIRTKQITSTELTKFFIERLKKYDPVLHCVITITEERALRQAKLMDEEIATGKYRGLLHGIPFGVKDLLSTKDYKTTWGAMPFKDQFIPEDAAVITKLEVTGAVLCAKLTMGALAWGDVWFGGMTRNPWDTTKGSSGSSAGSSSSVSAGLLPFAIGTETWGSIVSPSTVCGTTGLRPTYGRVSRTGAMALSWSMDKIGTICRTAEDLAIVFNAIYGQDGIDQSLYDVPFNYNPQINLKNLKVGYLKKDFDKEYDFHRNDSLTLAMLKNLGVNLIPIELPVFPINDLAIILSAEAAAAFDELTRSNKDDLLERQIKNAWPNSFRASRFIPAVEYINANRIRFQLNQEMGKLMKKVDLYIAPSWEGENLLLTNLTGHPCVVLPNGFTENGTPTSISFIGRLFDEGKIIAIAKAFQDVTDFHKKHPAGFR